MFSPLGLPGLLGWYDVHASGSATEIADSSGNSLAATSNAAGSNAALYELYDIAGLRTTGGVSNGARCNSVAAFDALVDFDMWIDLDINNLTPTSQTPLIERRQGTDPNNQFRYALNTDGTLSFVWYPSGTAASTLTRTTSSTVATATGLAAGGRIALRATLDADDGAGNHVVTFYYRVGGYDGTWDTFQTISTAGTTSTPTSFGSRRLELGGGNASNSGDINIHTAVLLSGIGGSGIARYDAHLSGGTGYTDAYGNAWSVTRATAGRKSIMMSPVANSTRSVWQFGTDDYATAPAGAIPAMGASDAWSIVLVIRQWDTPTNFGRYLSTKLSTGLGKGIAIRTNGTGRQIACHVGDGTNAVDTFGPAAATAGVLQVVVVACTGPLATVYVNGTPGTPVDVSSVGDRATGQMQIGRDAGSSSNYQDFELVAYGTVQGRALTDAEAVALSAFFNGGS